MALLFRVSGFFGLVSTSHVNYTCILGLQRRLQISRVPTVLLKINARPDFGANMRLQEPTFRNYSRTL